MVDRLRRPTIPQNLFFRRLRRESGRGFYKARDFVKALVAHLLQLTFARAVLYNNIPTTVDFTCYPPETIL